MVIGEWVRRFSHVLLDLLYPPRCVGCGQVGTLYCSACRHAVPLILPPVCPRCGRPQPRGDPCARCAAHPLQIAGIRSVAFFDGTLRKAIHEFKYRYVRELALPLGDMLVSAWPSVLLPADVILPVPLHARRQRARGYNQAALLAERLGRALGIPVANDALIRHRNTPSQTQLDAVRRRQNVAGAFSCRGSGVDGRRVLLIDDVCTTGSTVEACGLALQAGGAQSVWALTLACAKQV